MRVVDYHVAADMPIIKAAVIALSPPSKGDGDSRSPNMAQVGIVYKPQQTTGSRLLRCKVSDWPSAGSATYASNGPI